MWYFSISISTIEKIMIIKLIDVIIKMKNVLNKNEEKDKDGEHL